MKITSKGDSRTTEVFDADGNPIPSISQLDLSINANEMMRVTLTLEPIDLLLGIEVDDRFAQYKLSKNTMRILGDRYTDRHLQTIGMALIQASTPPFLEPTDPRRIDNTIFRKIRAHLVQIPSVDLETLLLGIEALTLMAKEIAERSEEPDLATRLEKALENADPEVLFQKSIPVLDLFGIAFSHPNRDSRFKPRHLKDDDIWGPEPDSQQEGSYRVTDLFEAPFPLPEKLDDKDPEELKTDPSPPHDYDNGKPDD